MQLYIYGEEPRHARHDESEGIAGMIQAADTIKLGARSLTELHAGLASLVAQGKTFRRVLVMTHGSPGSLSFGKDRINSSVLLGFAGKGYERLFPKTTKVYFSGCSVAAAPAGWQFLETFGQVLLKAGGYTMGWTSTGYGWNDAFSRLFLGGHSLHFSGDIRHVLFDVGGRVIERLSYDGGVFGDSVIKRAKIMMKLEAVVPRSA